MTYLSIRESYSLNFSVFPVDARCGDVNSHRGAPSRGLEWARFEAASATDPAGRHTVHFPTTLPFSKPTLRMTPIYVISDSSRWREYYRPPHTGGEGEAEAGRRGAAPPCGGAGGYQGSNKYTGTRHHSPFNTGTFQVTSSTGQLHSPID